MKPADYAFQSPTGEIYRGTNIRAFARQHGLDPGNLQKVHSGDKNHYKGWRSVHPDIGK